MGPGRSRTTFLDSRKAFVNSRKAFADSRKAFVRFRTATVPVSCGLQSSAFWVPKHSFWDLCPWRPRASLLDAFGVSWAGFGLPLVLYGSFLCTRGRRGSLRQFGENFWFHLWFILGSLLKCVSQFFQFEAWSRPRRRRGRRPHEMQDTLMMFALLVPSMFCHCLENLDGVGVVV